MAQRRKWWKRSIWYSYRAGVLSSVSICVVIVVANGGPFWPPYVLLFMIVVGVVAGLASVAYLRRWEGLSVLGRSDRDDDKGRAD